MWGYGFYCLHQRFRLARVFLIKALISFILTLLSPSWRA
jgi:hypothetical protein